MALAKEDMQMVQETVKELLQGLGPILQGMQISPEKLTEAFKQANKPYEDPALIARDLRERRKAREDFAAARAATAARQKNCPHKDKSDKNALCLTHNFPDNMPRGICPLCLIYIEPAHWDNAPPTPDDPVGKRIIIPEHPLYFMVREKEAMA